MGVRTRVAKLVALLRCRRWRAGLLHRVAAAVEHTPALSHLRPACIVDVGANKGQFTLFARATFPDARIHSFEPLAEACATFRRVFAGDANVRLWPVAIAPEAGRRTIHLSRRRDSSSLLPIGAGQAAAFPGTEAAGETTIETARLSDCLAPGDIAQPALLKLDVQGFELEALHGCRELLARFDHVYCECSFVELYDGQALADEVAAFLATHGFVEHGRHNVVTHPRLGPVQADVLFARARPHADPAHADPAQRATDASAASAA